MAYAGWNIVNDDKSESTDTATLLGVPIGVIGLVIAVMALRKPSEDNDAELARGRAGKLARQVKDSEGRVRRQLLGADIQRINLTYVLRSVTERAATAPPAGRTFADGPAALPDVLDYYRSTRPRRLVITGAAGAGKTVLALELLFALIEGRPEDAPVPVRIPLAQWDTNQPLNTLLAQRLTEVYDWPSDMAAHLVDHGLVLPILDGLDEMDPLRADGTPDPEAPRARAVLEALNAYQDGRDAGPLVLTCRTAHYDALGPAYRLIDAARVTIDPVDTLNATAYLRARILDTSRWQPLIDHLHAHPHSPLATILSTPWRLCLTATVYHREGNPAELLDHSTGHDVDRYLLSRYIPAATANTPNPRHYRPEDIHRWLHHLTRHLDGATTGTPVTDIALHRLWPLAGTTRVRAVDILLAALTIISAVSLCLAMAIRTGDDVYVLWGTLATVFAGIFAYRPTPKPSRLRITPETLPRGLLTRFWTGFVTWFAIGFTIGFIYGFVYADFVITAGIVVGSTAGLMVGLVGGLMGGLAGRFQTGFRNWFVTWFVIGATLNLQSYFAEGELDDIWDRMEVFCKGGLIAGLTVGTIGGFVRGLRGEPTIVASPRSIIRDDMVYGLAIGPITVLASLLLAALTSVPRMDIWSGLYGDLSNISYGLPLLDFQDGVVFGFAIGVATGLVAGFGRAARRYGVFLVCSRGKLPFRLAPFLDWAVTAGLLRYNGPAYQFRHRELQQWLAQHPRP
ncbi:NACHT domain-containing protein [Streptomyces sp. B146]|uniref:NACHT domain-containing protein n=1 Tax=Streptomyces sp. B146 TaxID=2944251 RepID=UPI00244EAFD8|nr:NACHT domain-containing protein [Streptomyces sp. B146]WGK50590.1 NACHT domain-containing protein [Streptomyces sp. B146]